MFLKTTKGKRQDYLYIVESYRNEAKQIRHRTICSLGPVKDISPEFIKSFGKLLKQDSKLSLVDLDDASILQHINYGGMTIVNHLWKYFELDKWVAGLKQNTKLKIDVEKVLKLLLASRMIKPESKLQTYQNQQYYSASSDVELHKIYRSLDFLANHQQELQQHLYQQQITKEKMSVTVAFYDVTTFYFESVKQDELKDFGFSKDCKFNQTQVMLSILVNSEGRPIRFDIHKGNKYEGHTLVKTLQSIKEEYAIKKVILVADKGINNGVNLLAIKEAGFDYIVGSRIKNMGKKQKSQILDLDSYNFLSANKEENEIFGYKTIEYNKEVKIEPDAKAKEQENKKQKQVIKGSLICTWSAKRARKDKADRERLVLKAQEMVSSNNDIVPSRGARKYIDAKIKDTPSVNYNKISEDAMWDGFYGIETSSSSLSALEIAEAYHQLWVVEESFRILKSHFETRPMFHWSPRRIEGHLTLSYIAFLFERTIELKLKDAGVQGVSHGRIRNALTSMETSIIQNANEKLQILTKPSELAESIILTFKLGKPMNSKV